jgi:hypothetical protein
MAARVGGAERSGAVGARSPCRCVPRVPTRAPCGPLCFPVGCCARTQEPDGELSVVLSRLRRENATVRKKLTAHREQAVTLTSRVKRLEKELAEATAVADAAKEALAAATAATAEAQAAAAQNAEAAAAWYAWSAAAWTTGGVEGGPAGEAAVVEGGDGASAEGAECAVLPDHSA